MGLPRSLRSKQFTQKEITQELNYDPIQKLTRQLAHESTHGNHIAASVQLDPGFSNLYLMARLYTGAYPRNTIQKPAQEPHTRAHTGADKQGNAQAPPGVHPWPYSATYNGEFTQGISNKPTEELTWQPTQESSKEHTQEPTLNFI